MRPTAAEALQHPWFQGVTTEEEEMVACSCGFEFVDVTPDS